MAVTAISPYSRAGRAARILDQPRCPDLVGGSAAARSHSQPSVFSARVLAARYADGSRRRNIE